jgi:hypothetical protein
VAGSIALTGIGGWYLHLSEVDARFDIVEMDYAVQQMQMDVVEDKVSDNRCMLIQQAKGENPLDCINE